MRGLVIAAIAVKFREIQTQLNGIKRALGTPPAGSAAIAALYSAIASA